MDEDESDAKYGTMRLLMLNHNLRGRGTWHRAWHLARELARRGHAVTVWTAAPHHYYRAAREEHEGVAIVETPSWAPLAGPDDGWGPLDAAWRVGRILLEPFDVCYAFAHPPNVFLPAWLARGRWGGGLLGRRRPLVYDWCDWYEGGIFPKRAAMRAAGLIPSGEPFLQARAERWEIGLERRMLRLADRVTVISRRLHELALAAGRREEDLLLLPNGANLEGIAPRDPGACRAALGLAGAGPWLGYVANYHPDQELLLRAFGKAAAREPGLKMIKTGPPFAAMLVEALGLGGRIVDLGFVEEGQLPLVLGAADALALPMEDNPSNRARLPYKFTDYLAAGRPIVTCRVGDLEEWFAPPPGEGVAEEAQGAHDAPHCAHDAPHGAAGVCNIQPDEPIGLASAPDPDSYGAAMIQLLSGQSRSDQRGDSEDPAAARAAMGAAARRLAQRHFAWPGLAEKVEKFIELKINDKIKNV